jgi:hypothetical protein
MLIAKQSQNRHYHHHHRRRPTISIAMTTTAAINNANAPTAAPNLRPGRSPHLLLDRPKPTSDSFIARQFCYSSQPTSQKEIRISLVVNAQGPVDLQPLPAGKRHHGGVELHQRRVAPGEREGERVGKQFIPLSAAAHAWVIDDWRFTRN